MLDAFNETFMRLALGASLTVAIVGAVLGVYVVLRRVVFVGAALSQISAAGVALAFLLGLSPNPTAFVVTLVAVSIFAFVTGGKRLSQESVLGLSYAAASAATILLIKNTAHGTDDIMNLLFGNILAVTVPDLAFMMIACALVLIVHIVCRRPFLFVSFDPEMARTLGFRTEAWNWLFYLTLGVAIASVTKVAGSLLTFSFLVIPAMTALSLASGMRAIFAVSIGSAVLAAVIGLWASFAYDVSTGPAMVAVSTLLLALGASLGAVLRRVRAHA
jgi:zinc transport system permease protein